VRVVEEEQQEQAGGGGRWKFNGRIGTSTLTLLKPNCGSNKIINHLVFDN
jgi:hypothetical protein